MRHGKSRARLRIGPSDGSAAIGGSTWNSALSPWAILVVFAAIVALFPRVNAGAHSNNSRGGGEGAEKNKVNRADNGLGLLANACAAHCSNLNGLDLWVSVTEVCTTEGSPALRAIVSSSIPLPTKTWSYPVSALVCATAMIVGLCIGWRGGTGVARYKADPRPKPRREIKRYPLL